MKTSPQISKAFLIILLSFVQLNIVTTAFGKTKTGLITYKSQLIPHVNLPEVIIYSENNNLAKGEICEMIKVGNEYIPSVQLNEVNICGSNNCTFANAENHSKIEHNLKNATSVISYKGNLIPNIYGPEVTCSADKIVTDISTSQNIQDDNLVKLSVRQGFDRLLNYFVKKGGEILRHIIPSTI